MSDKPLGIAGLVGQPNDSKPPEGGLWAICPTPEDIALDILMREGWALAFSHEDSNTVH